MIGLDTNVLVRFLVQDDEVQSPMATRFMSRLSRERPGFVSVVVVAETSWVLSRAYRYSRARIANAIEGLLRSSDIIIESGHAVWRALAAYQGSPAGEFADALIAQSAARAGCDQTVTFDEAAATAFGMRLLR